MNTPPKRRALVACEVLFRELAGLAARSRHVIDLVFLPKGLHDEGGEKMRAVLQAEITRLDRAADYGAVMLGYGLCNNGTAGLSCARAPLVIPRAHDCIALFFGSRRRYREYFFAHPGTYFHTAGWLERGGPGGQAGPGEAGGGNSLAEFTARYGEDNGRYLWAQLDPARHYRRAAYLGVPLPWLPDGRARSRRAAEEKGWAWEEIAGDPSLLERLVDGPWPADDFLVLAPGETARPSNDETIFRACARCAGPAGAGGTRGA